MIVAAITSLHLGKRDDSKNTVSEVKADERYRELMDNGELIDEFPWVLALNEAEAEQKLRKLILKRMPKHFHISMWIFDFIYTPVGKDETFTPLNVAEAEAKENCKLDV